MMRLFRFSLGFSAFPLIIQVSCPGSDVMITFYCGEVLCYILCVHCMLQSSV